jgi:hypothetical protein
MFPDLFAAIGTTYGAGDGSTTFNVPDYNAAKRFAQGDTVAGTVKSAGLPNIEGSTDGGGGWHPSSSHSGAISFAGTTTTYLSSLTGNGYVNLIFDASLSNPIYGNSDTVQPNALTARYIIKAFDGQTADSALIDITQYANELAGKANRDLDNLSADGENHFLENDFAIIYPNGGSEASPANVTVNSSYIESSPFPGYYVYCLPELYLQNQWLPILSTCGNQGTGNVTWGILASGAFDDSNTINIRTMTTGLILRGCTTYPNDSDPALGSVTTAPCRVKVWKIGKIPTA